jgi:hypothetical protein
MSNGEHKVQIQKKCDQVALSWFQLIISVLVILVSVVVSFTTVWERAEQNRVDIAEIQDNMGDMTEIKINIKRLCEHFDVEYLEK